MNEHGLSVSIPKSVSAECWPVHDQELWIAARKHAGFLSGSAPARNWSESRCRIGEQAYGQWLSWLYRNPGLDAAAKPENRVTPARVEAFIKELQGRVAPWSVAMMIGALQRMLEVMAPKADWGWLKDVASDLKVAAKPSRDKRAHMVSPEQLYDLGIKLMTEAHAENAQGRHHAATKGRDGLLIALLICCPVRIANLLEIEIGGHLQFDSDHYWLRFSHQETKTGEAYEGDLPIELTPRIDEYLELHRLKLLARAEKRNPTSRLWVDRWGKPMEEAGMRAQIEKRTRDAFGTHVWPHLFRDISVTGLVDHSPEDITIAPDLLGHATLRTTQKHYIQARGMQAHKDMQESVMRGRAEAMQRLRNNRL